MALGDDFNKLKGESLKKELEKHSKSLLDVLEKQREDVKVFRKDSNLARTIEWLFSTQNENGSWGRNNVAYTSTVMLALVEVKNLARIWNLDEEIGKSLELSEKFLNNKYQENSFERAIWDTSVATRALILGGKNSRVFVSQTLIPFLLNINTKRFNAGPHHLAQRILTLRAFSADQHIIKEEVLELYNLLHNRDWGKYSPYVIAQCLEALDIDEPIEDLDLNPFVEHLINWLENTTLDSANFINICSALKAIKPSLNLKLEKRLKTTVSSFFGPNCFRNNGSWYFDELMTSYAILALARFDTQILISAPKSELYYEVNYFIDKISKSIEKYQKKTNYNWLVHVLSMFFAGAILSTFIVYSTLKDDMFEWLKYILPTIGSGLIIFSFRDFFSKFTKK
jgi:hypothetical protein